MISVASNLLNGCSDLLRVSSDLELKPEVREVGATIVIHVPVELKRVNGQRRMRTAKDALPVPEPWPQHEALVTSLARGHAWLLLIKRGVCQSIDEVAKLAGVDPSFVGRLMKLTLLAPDIQEAILQAKEPADLSLERLRKGFPLEWSEQRRVLGFPEPVLRIGARNQN